MSQKCWGQNNLHVPARLHVTPKSSYHILFIRTQLRGIDETPISFLVSGGYAFVSAARYLFAEIYPLQRDKCCRGENKKLGLQSVWSNFKVCKLGLLGLLSFLCQQFFLRSWAVAQSKGRFLLLMKKGKPFPQVPQGPCAWDWDM